MQVVLKDKKHTPFILMAAIWIILQTILLYTNHVGTINEAPKYIEQAQYLLIHHTVANEKYIFYFLPILTIAIGIKANLGLAFTIFVQLFVNALASVAFYKIACHFFGRGLKSYVATVIYLTFIPLQQWNSFIYTESLFYSFCVFFIYACTLLPNKTASTHILRLLALLLLIFTRPLGFVFIPVWACFYMVTSKIPNYAKWIIAAGALVLPYILFNFLYKTGIGLDILLPQQQGMVICTDDLVDVNYNLTIPNTNNPVNDLMLFIWYNPVYFSKLALARLMSFFNLSRPSYSFLHNAYFIVYMAALYGGTIVCFIKSQKSQYLPLKNTFVPAFVVLIIGVMLQCNEFNNRFTLTLFPWYILFAADGLVAITKGKPR